MRLFAIVLLLSITGAVMFGKTEVLAEEKPNINNKSKVVVVKNGDTLTKIAKKHHTTYKRLFNANKKIENPDLIYPGDKVRIPAKDEKIKNRSVAMLSADSGYTYQVQSSPAKSNFSAPSSSGGNYNGGVWDKLAACESGGNWSTNTGNGYYGGLQFNVGTWQSNGGSGYPHQASKAEQIRVAKNLQSSRGFSPWPACSAKLGL